MGAHYFLHERVNRATVAGLFLALGGVVWLTLAGTPSRAASNPLLGNTLELGAMISAVAYMLMVKRLTERYNPWTLTALQIAAGFLFFSPGSLFFFRGGFQTVAPLQLATLAYLGVFVSLGAFGLYNLGIKYIPANRASAMVNLIPVIAVFFGWVLLGEKLNSYQMAAAVCVLGGVWLSQRNG